MARESGTLGGAAPRRLALERPSQVIWPPGAIGHLAVQHGARVIIAISGSQCRLEGRSGAVGSDTLAASREVCQRAA